MHIFLAMIALIGYSAAGNNPEAVTSLKAQAQDFVQVEKNIETGLTDFSVAGYEFSLEVLNVNTTTFND